MLIALFQGCTIKGITVFVHMASHFKYLISDMNSEVGEDMAEFNFFHIFLKTKPVKSFSKHSSIQKLISFWLKNMQGRYLLSMEAPTMRCNPNGPPSK